MTTFYSQMRKGDAGNATKSRKLNKEEIKQQLIN